MHRELEAFEPRWSGRIAWAGAAAWCGLCIAFTIPSFSDHVAYFGDRLGASYEQGIVGVLAGLGLCAAVYTRLRRIGLWKYEPRLLAALALALMAWGSPKGVAAGGLLAVVAFALGAAALDRAGLTTSSPVVRLGLSGATGAGLLALGMIPLGLAGAYSPVAFWLISAGVCIAAMRRIAEIPGHLRALERQWMETPALQSPLAGIAVAFLPAFLACNALASTAPAIAYDAVSHHLPAARYYLEGGQLEPLPVPPGAFQTRWLHTLGHAVAYSYYPQSFEELLTLAWGLGGQGAAQTVAPLTCLVSLLLLVGVGRLCGVSRLGCTLGAAAAYALPFAHWIGAISKNDYLLALFQLAALYAVLRARRGDGRRWLIAGAFFLGLSVGVKHTAVFLSFPLGLLLLWELRGQLRPWRLAPSMALAFVLTGLFWHVRTYLLTGNPLYPATAERGAQTAPAIDGTKPSRWAIPVTYPWYVHFDGRKTLELPSRSPAGFFFLFFAPLWLLYRRRLISPGERAVLFALLVFYAYWTYIWGVLRYGLGPALLLAILTADRLAAWWESRSSAKATAAASFAYCMGFALLPTLMFEVNQPQIAWYLGRLDAEGYLRAAMSDYPTIAFLNGRQGPEETVLAVNNCSSVYSVDPARFRCVRYRSAMEQEVLEAIAGVVERSDPDYLVAPTGQLGDTVLGFLPVGQWSTPIFEDGAFRVLSRVRTSVSSPTKQARSARRAAFLR